MEIFKKIFAFSYTARFFPAGGGWGASRVVKR